MTKLKFNNSQRLSGNLFSALAQDLRDAAEGAEIAKPKGCKILPKDLHIAAERTKEILDPSKPPTGENVRTVAVRLADGTPIVQESQGRDDYYDDQSTYVEPLPSPEKQVTQDFQPSDLVDALELPLSASSSIENPESPVLLKINKVDPQRSYLQGLQRLPKDQRALRSLAEFLKQGWFVLEPTTPLVWNWHLDMLCSYLQAMIEDWMAVQRYRMAHPDDDEYDFDTLSDRSDDHNVLISHDAAHNPDDPDSIYTNSDEPLLRIQNLIINIPPGTSKSRVTSVFLPAWVWLWWPSFRWTFISANPSVAMRDSMFCRDLMKSDWYQDTFKPTWDFEKSQDAKQLFKNTAGGSRQARGAGSKITGDRGDALVGDDLNDIATFSETERDNVNVWWDTAAGNRIADLKSSLRICIQQRVHEDDHTGHVLGNSDIVKWYHLIIQQEYEENNGCQCWSCKNKILPLGELTPKDPRRTSGELLDPRRMPKKVLEGEAERLGDMMYSAQHQQRPAPEGGGIFKEIWWNYWRPAAPEDDPEYWERNPLSIIYSKRIGEVEDARDALVINPLYDLPEEFDEIAQSWDMSFKDTKSSDLIAGGVYGRKGANIYLLDLYHSRGDIVKAIKAIRDMTEKWPDALAKLVEDKANGPAVISILRSEIPGLIAIDPGAQDKTGRARAMSVICEARNVYLPHPDLIGYRWVKRFRAEVEGFPNLKHDDIVDQFAQMLKRWFDKARMRIVSVPAVRSGLPNSVRPNQTILSPESAVGPVHQNPIGGGFDQQGLFVPPQPGQNKRPTFY